MREANGGFGRFRQERRIAPGNPKFGHLPSSERAVVIGSYRDTPEHRARLQAALDTTGQRAGDFIRRAVRAAVANAVERVLPGNNAAHGTEDVDMNNDDCGRAEQGVTLIYADSETAAEKAHWYAQSRNLPQYEVREIPVDGWDHRGQLNAVIRYAPWADPRAEQLAQVPLLGTPRGSIYIVMPAGYWLDFQE